jgi:hypothetical protein
MIKIYCSGPIQLLTDHSMGHSDVLHLERYVMTFLANGNKPTKKKNSCWEQTLKLNLPALKVTKKQVNNP